MAARSANHCGRSAEGVGAVVAREAGAVRVSGMFEGGRGVLGERYLEVDEVEQANGLLHLWVNRRCLPFRGR